MQQKSKQNQKSKKKVCQVKEDKLRYCAHEANKFLQSENLLHKYKADDWCDYKGGLCLCTCGKPIKPKNCGTTTLREDTRQLKNWAKNLIKADTQYIKKRLIRSCLCQKFREKLWKWKSQLEL